MRYLAMVLLGVLGGGAVYVVTLPDRSGPMVRWMEAHGAGDVRQASVRSIATWLHAHPDVGIAAKKECQAQTPSDAEWGDNPDGRVCDAAASLEIFQPRAFDTTRFTP